MYDFPVIWAIPKGRNDMNFQAWRLALIIFYYTPIIKLLDLFR